MSAAGRPLRALVIEHERATPGGIIEAWLERREADVDILRIDAEARDSEPRDYDIIVSLGSEFAAYDDSLPWIARERELLGAAIEADVPVLGVCFGGQLLARVLGGDVFRSEREEIGWLPVRSRDPALVPEGPWFQWHFDSFTLPAGATLVADNDAGPQAFVHGRSLGLQFHPEVTPEIMDAWVVAYRHELDENGVDPDGLLVETRERAAASKAVGERLLDAFLDRTESLERVGRRGGGA